MIQNCKASGLAESAYPPGNLGTDTHVDTGITDPGNDAASIGQEFIGGIYAIVAHVLTWILLGLALAFGFDLFRSDAAGGNKIGAGLSGAEHLFSLPLIPLALIVGAGIGIVYWFGQRAEGRAVTHWAGMVALMVAALVIAQNPVGVFGWADTAANSIANASLAAFSGQGGGSNGGFANAVPGIYKTGMEEPWCAMEFGNESWCMAPIDPAMAAARTSVAAHIDQALGDQGSSQLAHQQAPAELLRMADAKTNGELFLSFIPNADARNGQNDRWTLYSALLNDHPELASIRASGGVWERFGILFLSVAAGLGFLLLLLYISWQLVVNSVFFVILLLLTPVVILTPAFGEGGRGVFFRWLTHLLEALAKRIIFSIYLGVILLATNIFLSIGSSLGGWLMEWLVLAAIWWMAFLYRHKILGLMTAGLYQRHGHPSATQRLAGYRRRPRVEGDGPEHHYYGDTYEGDTYQQHAHTYQQHAHVYANGNAYSYSNGGTSAPVIEGEARELEE